MPLSCRVPWFHCWGLHSHAARLKVWAECMPRVLHQVLWSCSGYSPHSATGCKPSGEGQAVLFCHNSCLHGNSTGHHWKSHLGKHRQAGKGQAMLERAVQKTQRAGSMRELKGFLMWVPFCSSWLARPFHLGLANPDVLKRDAVYLVQT